MSTKPHHFSRNKCARHNVALRSHKSKCAIIDDDKEVLKLPLYNKPFGEGKGTFFTLPIPPLSGLESSEGPAF